MARSDADDAPTRTKWSSQRRWWVTGAYAALLALSHLVTPPAPSPNADPEGVSSSRITMPIMDRDGPIGGEQDVFLRRWPSSGAPVILLHGSPGDSGAFERLGELLAQRGFDVVAPDLPGFGRSVSRQTDYSVRAHARAMIRLADELDFDPVHVIAWSQGGGVALHMASLAPKRVKTISLVGSIGVQEAEGSGNYHFEHFKYALGYAGLVLGAETIPHFGLLGSFAERHAFICNFAQTDQRLLAPIMDALETPTLILHGRGDFLTPIRAAQASHARIAPSRLVVVEGSHFLPVVQPELVAQEFERFALDAAASAKSDRTSDIRTTDIRAPDSPSAGAIRALEHVQMLVPWWGLLALAAWWASRRPETAAALLGVASTLLWIDIGLACVALLLGVGGRAIMTWRLGRRSRRDGTVHDASLDSWAIELRGSPLGFAIGAHLQPWRRDEALRAAASIATRDQGWKLLAGHVLGVGVWCAASILPAFIGSALVFLATGRGVFGLVVASVVALLVTRATLLTLSRRGRWRLGMWLDRPRRHEFWPPWLFYAPLVPWLALLAIRHRGPMTFTCVNPAIGGGGGVIGESKGEMQAGLDALGSRVLTGLLIEPGTVETRLEQLRDSQAAGRLPDYPIVLKPDAGQRGYGVRIARAEADAREYFTRMDRPVFAQAYHPGPVEVGVMWVRTPSERSGRIFSITTKRFPTIEGDGRTTLEELICRHRRYRHQAHKFLDRLADRRHEVPALGETVDLGRIGNHAEGAAFLDGEDLRTPALEAWIDGASSAFRNPGAQPGVPNGAPDNGLDFGRFDIRASSPDGVRKAQGLAIIELNGTTAESTNLYDPDRSVFWAWRLLFRQWALVYRLGQERRAEGVKPLTFVELVRAWRSFEHARPDMGAAR